MVEEIDDKNRDAHLGISWDLLVGSGARLFHVPSEGFLKGVPLCVSLGHQDDSSLEHEDGAHAPCKLVGALWEVGVDCVMEDSQLQTREGLRKEW